MSQVQISEQNLRRARLILANAIPISRMLRDVTRDNRIQSEGKMCCPVHDENTPSFHYSDMNKSGNCFGCHMGGTVVEIYMHIKRKEVASFSQYRAILELARLYNVELPDLTTSIIPPEERVRKSTRARGTEHTDHYYAHKLEQVPVISRQAPLPIRYEVSKTLDNVYLGRLTVKEGYIRCRELLKL